MFSKLKKYPEDFVANQYSIRNEDNQVQVKNYEKAINIIPGGCMLFSKPTISTQFTATYSLKPMEQDLGFR